jgi:hypothetical protein
MFAVAVDGPEGHEVDYATPLCRRRCKRQYVIFIDFAGDAEAARQVRSHLRRLSTTSAL